MAVTITMTSCSTATTSAKTTRLLPVACLGYGRHGTCHGRNFEGGAKVAWQKLEFHLQFLEPLFCAPYNHKLQSYISTARRYLMY